MYDFILNTQNLITFFTQSSLANYLNHYEVQSLHKKRGPLDMVYYNLAILTGRFMALSLK